jgi:lipopolysaccharide transport system ATP-binding protein
MSGATRIELRDVSVLFPLTPPEKSLKRVLVRMFTRTRREEPKMFAALSQVTLLLQHGERVGVIGPNGAGKSTLLKVMGGIYPPSIGQAAISGHVCPLFEFATGFEMDLSGWDNIRIRCMLLGMKRAEIEDKMAEIGEFSGLGEFLDRPVRTYSTGMFVRLAFSVSTAVDPEILLLDEVMGAGDKDFASKARRRMLEFIEKGSLVVYVSHALEMLRDICSRVILLQHGRIVMDGPAKDVIEFYKAN